MSPSSRAQTNLQNQMPVFDLQVHHSKVSVPTEFDIRDLSKKYHVFPLKVIVQNDRRKVLLAMRNPFDQVAVRDVEFRSGMSVVPVQADEKDIQWLVQVHYYGRKLSPSPSTEEREVSHDVFAQLEMTTDAQKAPEWLDATLKPFYTEE